MKRDPTPKQIRSRCLAIQREWSERERLKRMGRGPYRFPTVRLDLTFRAAEG